MASDYSIYSPEKFDQSTMTVYNYVIVIEKAANNYSALCPDVLGCVTTGSTVEETKTNMKDALEFHLEDETGMPVARTLQQLETAGVFNELADEFSVSAIEISRQEN